MATSNMTNATKVRARVPARGTEISFEDLHALAAWLDENLYVEDTTDSDDGTLSFGQSDPQGETGAATTLHIARTEREEPRAFRVWSRTKWVDLHRLVVGQVALFPLSLEPDGWVLADGSGGTLDLSGASPHEAIAYYEFRGF